MKKLSAICALFFLYACAPLTPPGEVLRADFETVTGAPTINVVGGLPASSPPGPPEDFLDGFSRTATPPLARIVDRPSGGSPGVFNDQALFLDPDMTRRGERFIARSDRFEVIYTEDNPLALTWDGWETVGDGVVIAVEAELVRDGVDNWRQIAEIAILDDTLVIKGFVNDEDGNPRSTMDERSVRLVPSRDPAHSVELLLKPAVDAIGQLTGFGQFELEFSYQDGLSSPSRTVNYGLGGTANMKWVRLVVLPSSESGYTIDQIRGFQKFIR